MNRWWQPKDGKRDGRSTGLLARLARDVRGNTLAIVGAAMIPLTAMIGSGVDMSRAYMAKHRLQSACDAAALAGRRVMQNDTLTNAVTNEAVKFFNFNFRQGLYATDAFTPVVTRPASGTIRVTAATKIPTAIMSVFGWKKLNLAVTCDASQNYVNTDVVLVLDVTGSMLNDINDNSTSWAPNQKITALRDAVMALYDQLAPVQAQLEAGGYRLRYSVVPYSSSVNVGKLITAVDPSYIASSVPYQSWTANYTNYITNTISDTGQVSETYSSSMSSTECTKFQGNISYPTLDGATRTTGGPDPANKTKVTVSARDWGGWGTTDTSGTSRTCRRYKQTEVTQSGYQSTGQTYKAVTDVDTSQFKLGNSVAIANDDNGLMPSSLSNANPIQVAANAVGESSSATTWNGCIEERDTVSTITSSSGYAIPSGATDLDINLIPNSNATRWKPMWPEMVWRRTAGYTTTGSGTQMSSYPASQGYWACPTEARRLQAWSRSNLLSYINTLAPVGGTYHDIGMLWGGRMISSGGIFADSPDAYNNMPVTRHIIFMTDGQLAPNCNSYTAYGVEQNDMRVTGSGSCPNQYDRHLQRFKMICNSIKSMNTSIWVIAFGTTMSSDMEECASSTNQAATSASRDALIAKFQEIGKNIGALRLTQ